jgi:hypothetical protein
MAVLEDLIKSRDIDALKAFMVEHDLVVRDGAIVPRDAAVAKHLNFLVGFWDQRQQARKILLNSLYGALLNEGLRFYDERLGQSVTLTGRSIARHMNAKANETITGVYDHTGEAIVYADTDSCYFSAAEILKKDPAYADFDFSRDNVVELYDGISDVVNESFPDFMVDRFNTSYERGAIIQAGRELVASRGLFIKKKKYAVLMYDKDGKRLDSGNKPGKLKAMGLDLKRSDTPKFMQKFLETILMDLLQDASKSNIMNQITDFREAFKSRPAVEKGSPKKVNGLTGHDDKVKATQINDVMRSIGGKANIPGHVRASLNWNYLCDLHNDKHSMRISDGYRIIVCKLRPNPDRIDSIAYPMDEPHLPQWFKDLPFDEEAMEETIIDKKVNNLLGVLDWDLENTKRRPGDEFFRF